METLQLSTEVIDWAAAQAGSSLSQFALKISKRAPELVEQGELTHAQIVKFAKATGVPLGYLFLDEPPAKRKLPVVDFRTLSIADPLSRDFYETFDDIEFKQSWYKEMLISSGADSLQFVGKYWDSRPPSNVLAKDIREALSFNEESLRTLKSPSDLYSLLSTKCEEIGILIFKNGIVGGNTHRPLSVSEFRGFVLADQFVPAIFINGADAPAAWVFTLAHELAHLWLGDSVISDADPSSNNSLEIYCNSVAAEFLVPKDNFLDAWEKFDEISDESKIDRLRLYFKVSSLVIARRALDLQLISKDTYKKIYLLARKKGTSEAGGGDYYRTLAVRNGKKFSKRVSSMAMAGAITLGQAGRLLNANPNKVVKLYEKQNAISL